MANVDEEEIVGNLGPALACCMVHLPNNGEQGLDEVCKEPLLSLCFMPATKEDIQLKKTVKQQIPNESSVDC
jgi:hypothetical protein